LAAVESAKATDAALAQAIEIGGRVATLPSQPPACKGPVRSGVAPDDRVDAALIKQDRALTKANATLASCAKLYEKIRTQSNGTVK